MGGFGKCGLTAQSSRTPRGVNETAGASFRAWQSVNGCSTGLGRELAKLVLARGQRAVVTARNRSQIADLVEPYPEAALGIALDVTQPTQIHAAVAQAEERFARVDVLVNNAGYGYLAAVEEGEADQVRAIFETNVFGLIEMTTAVLPGMRKRGAGHVFNVSSIGGLVGFAATGYYHATKFAVEGLSESLAAEHDSPVQASRFSFRRFSALA